jgi:hypothetical protein
MEEALKIDNLCSVGEVYYCSVLSLSEYDPTTYSHLRVCECVGVVCVCVPEGE